MPSYFFTSQDDLLLREEAEKASRNTDIEVFYGQDLNLTDFKHRLTTASLFTETRAVWLKDVAHLPRGKRTISQLTDLCARIPQEITLILSQNTYFDGDYRKESDFRSSALRKQLEKAADITKEIALKGRALREWAVTRALKRYSLKLSSSQADRLAEACLQLPSMMDSELMKFSLLRKSDVVVPVREEVFSFVLTRTLGSGIRELVDTALARDKKAFSLAQDVFRQQETGGRLFSDLYRGFQRLLAIRTDPQHRSRPEFRGMHRFVQQKLAAAAARWSTPAAIKALTLITDAEFRQRTNRILGHSSQQAERNLVLLLLKQLAAL